MDPRLQPRNEKRKEGFTGRSEGPHWEGYAATSTASGVLAVSEGEVPGRQGSWTRSGISRKKRQMARGKVEGRKVVYNVR